MLKVLPSHYIIIQPTTKFDLLIAVYLATHSHCMASMIRPFRVANNYTMMPLMFLHRQWATTNECKIISSNSLVEGLTIKNKFYHFLSLYRHCNSGNYQDVTVETLYSTIYHSKYFIELNFDKSSQYVVL